MSATSLPFGAWLRQLRTEHDLTQEALAELADCSVQAIRFFESGKRRPSLIMAEHLAEVLEIPPAEWEPFIAAARRPLDATDAAAPDAREALAVHTAPRPETALRSTLPPPDQPLIGRKGERNVLCQLLVKEQHRLVTVVGAGGVGKTHLVLAVANAMADQFADGVAFVPLAPLRAAAHLPSAVANALQLSLGSDEPGEQVLTALAARRLLLIL
ncbi:MAG: helix-turn-helix transcriptional regulator, partial [Caldilineaceae bacterium]|nr:helix-turn-helix transcriptional regulator [Caldilineaceae bacterium]